MGSRISQSQHDGHVNKSPKKKKAKREREKREGRETQKEKDIEHVFAGIEDKYHTSNQQNL